MCSCATAVERYFGGVTGRSLINVHIRSEHVDMRSNTTQFVRCFIDP